MHILTNFLSIQYNMLLIYGALFSQSSINFVTGSNNCYRYLKNAVQYFFAEIYIVMVLICFHLANFHIYESFPFSDLYQDFLVRRYQFYFYRASKYNVERFFWTQYFHFIDTFSTQNSLLFSIFSWFLYTTSVIDMVT